MPLSIRVRVPECEPLGPAVGVGKREPDAHAPGRPTDIHSDGHAGGDAADHTHAHTDAAQDAVVPGFATPSAA